MRHGQVPDVPGHVNTHLPTAMWSPALGIVRSSYCIGCGLVSFAEGMAPGRVSGVLGCHRHKVVDYAGRGNLGTGISRIRCRELGTRLDVGMSFTCLALTCRVHRALEDADCKVCSCLQSNNTVCMPLLVVLQMQIQCNACHKHCLRVQPTSCARISCYQKPFKTQRNISVSCCKRQA